MAVYAGERLRNIANMDSKNSYNRARYWMCNAISRAHIRIEFSLASSISLY